MAALYFILNKLSQLDRFKLSPSILLNKDGYWLKGPNSDEEWGFMYKDRMGLTFESKYKEEWKRIKNNEEGQFITSNGMFTYSSIRPINLFQKNRIQHDGHKHFFQLGTVPPRLFNNKQQLVQRKKKGQALAFHFVRIWFKHIVQL